MAKDNKRNTAIYTAFDDYDSGEVPVPERGLLRAILVNAIADMNREDEFARKARAYFLSKEDDYIFSFQAVCSYLNINPRAVLMLVGIEAGTKTDKVTEADPKNDSESAEQETPDLVLESLLN
jgi:hypothetical protein